MILSSVLDQVIAQADGSYLSDVELSSIQGFIDSYSLRTRTYHALREQTEELILNTLRQLMRTNRQVVQTHGNVCKRDMDYILRYISIGILKDDKQEFTDLVFWMENITKALKKEDSAIRAYQSLHASIKATMPLEMVQLIDPYFDLLIKALATGMNITV